MNAICLACASVHCVAKNHANDHYTNSKHPIVYNVGDNAFWCIECKSKINSAALNPIAKVIGKPLVIDYSIERVVYRIKASTIKKIVVVVGAGLSVAAGVPDFLNPNGGLYNVMKEFPLFTYKDLISIEWFKSKPEVLYKLLQPLAKKYFPTKGHYFIRLLQDKGLLFRSYTQNIDGLEIDAGVKKELLLQMRGTITSSHCINCKEKVSEGVMGQHLMNGKLLMCEKCNIACKPDIAFFGEPSSFQFLTLMQQAFEADLVISIGYDWKPICEIFNSIIIFESIAPKVPRVIIDQVAPPEIVAENQRKNIVLSGDIETTIDKLVDMLGYRAEFELLMKEREDLIKKYEEDKAKGIVKLF